MKSGIYLIESANGVSPAAASLSDPAYLAGVARAAEAAGLDSVWIPDHVVIPVEYRSRYPYQSYDGDTFERYPWDETAFPEPLTALTFAAAVTERVELCTGVVILPERNPVFLAKQVATVDRLSGGRLRLGVGIGWLREEFDAVGIPWERRGRRTDEAIEAMRALWTQDEASYAGATVAFERIRCRPAPVRPYGVPIVVGGHSEASARRAGRLGDGFLPIVASGDSFADETRHLLGVMRDAALQAGRDPDAVEISGFGSEDPAGLEAQREAGFDHVFHFVCEPDLDAAQRRIEAIAQLGRRCAHDRRRGPRPRRRAAPGAGDVARVLRAEAPAARIAALDAEETYPAEILDGMAGLGLWGIAIDEAYGGNPGDATMRCIVVEEVQRAGACLAYAFIPTALFCAEAIGQFGTAEQRDAHLPALAAGGCAWRWRSASPTAARI